MLVDSLSNIPSFVIPDKKPPCGEITAIALLAIGALALYVATSIPEPDSEVEEIMDRFL